MTSAKLRRAMLFDMTKERPLVATNDDIDIANRATAALANG
jgi:hypothetical protein